MLGQGVRLMLYPREVTECVDCLFQCSKPDSSNGWGKICSILKVCAYNTLLQGIIYDVLPADDSHTDFPLVQYLLEITQQVVNGDPSIGSFFLTTDDSGTLEVEGSWPQCLLYWGQDFVSCVFILQAGWMEERMVWLWLTALCRERGFDQTGCKSPASISYKLTVLHMGTSSRNWPCPSLSHSCHQLWHLQTPQQGLEQSSADHLVRIHQGDSPHSTITELHDLSYPDFPQAIHIRD